MARIPTDEIEQLKNDVSVERLVESAGIELKKSGKDRIGVCPFHDDSEPSLVVTPAKNLWHCFGCQIGGGPIDWVMKFRGVSFRHAVELLRADPSLAAAGVAGAGEVGERFFVALHQLVVVVAYYAAIRPARSRLRQASAAANS